MGLGAVDAQPAAVVHAEGADLDSIAVVGGISGKVTDVIEVGCAIITGQVRGAHGLMSGGPFVCISICFECVRFNVCFLMCAF